MSSKNILSSFRNGVRKIIISKPEKKNAIDRDMYVTLANILNEDANNDKVVLTIITGAGAYYSSGNDLESSMKKGANLNGPKSLIQAFIDYPKLLIAVINGPAIGVAATTAALCDVVYASDKAYFHTPFLTLGLCAEGASSYMFPRILGRSKASEALFLNKRISAEEAYKFGLVSEVIPHEKLPSFIEGLYKYGLLPVNTLKLNKALVMHELKPILSKANLREFEALESCVTSEEFGELVIAFMQRKSKL